MEKKTSGTITVKSRFRKMSPNGLNTAASFLKTMPTRAPRIIEHEQKKGKPAGFQKRRQIFFIIIMSPERCKSCQDTAQGAAGFF
ncbi:MAG: hypothetical protein MZU95_16995 [Desulfomicrobium escambiense]|nr:hypothetical protein [Desulfomicrobium escambiense]